MDSYELEREIDNLKRKVDDLEYDLRRAVDELETNIARKADKHHEHES